MRLLLTLAPAAIIAATALQAERLTDAPLVDPAWLTANLGNESLLVIDVRDPVDDVNVYDAGHVPGAISAPYAGYGWREEVNGIPGMLPPVDSIAARIGALGIDADTHVVIVSEGTDSTEFGKATRVYWTLKVLGHDAVSILDGGQIAWAAAGGAISTEGATPVAAEFLATLRPELLATQDEVRAAIEADTALVDGRPVAQYLGAEKAGPVRVPGTIPTAVNIPHGDLYQQTFVPGDVVASLAGAVGVADAADTITFCNTGHWASIAWFGLSEVGGQQSVAMYDGSMVEWAADESNPVVVLQ